MTVIIAIPPKMGVIQANIGFRTLVCRCGGDVCSWFVGELLAAPLRWGCVTLGWCGLFGAAGGVATQIVSRMSNLADVIWNNAPKRILEPFPAQVQGAKSVY